MNWKLDTYGAIQAYLYKIVQRDSIAYLRRERKRTIIHRAAQKPAITTETGKHCRQVIKPASKYRKNTEITRTGSAAETASAC